MIKVGSVTLDQLRASADGLRRTLLPGGPPSGRLWPAKEWTLRWRPGCGLLIVLAGLPEPRVNLIVRGIDGEWHRRYDLAYENLQLIIEYDGRQHASDTTQWLTDIHRREQLDRMHWRIIVVTSEGIYREPAETLRRIRCRPRRLRGGQGAQDLQGRVAAAFPRLLIRVSRRVRANQGRRVQFGPGLPSLDGKRGINQSQASAREPQEVDSPAAARVWGTCQGLAARTGAGSRDSGRSW